LGISYKAILYKFREFGIGRPRAQRRAGKAMPNVVAPPSGAWDAGGEEGGIEPVSEADG
jgi:hypothetical protein